LGLAICGLGEAAAFGVTGGKEGGTIMGPFVEVTAVVITELLIAVAARDVE